MRFERVHVVGHGACFAQQYLAFRGQPGKAIAPIEKLYAQLRLEVGQGLTDNGLRASQFSPGSREAALLGGSDEGAQLVERDAVEHGLAPRKAMDDLSYITMDRIESHRLLGWTERAYAGIQAHKKDA